MFYGINGTGLGHISRLLNIAREARGLLHAMNLEADFHFLTTSEAPQVAWDFPVTKLPSKTVVRETDTPHDEYAAYAQFLITNLVATLRPDLLVMDTMPQGSFGEFLLLRPFAKRRVLVNRHKDAAIAQSAAHRQHLPLYDLILVPDREEHAARYVITEDVRGRTVFTDVVHGFRADEALGRVRVREQFGVRDDQILIYVSAGGGGDAYAERELSDAIAAASADPAHVVLVGYGPLYRGRKVYARNVIPLTEPDVRAYFPGLDCAVSAAGYNAYEELLAAGVPTVFWAQAKGMDRQDERVRLGAEHGWHLALPRCEPEAIRAAIATLTSVETRTSIAQALAARGPSYGALRSAVELLKLHASLPHSRIDPRALNVVALLRQSWMENVAARAGAYRVVRQVGSPAASFPTTCAAAFAWLRGSMGAVEWGQFLAATSTTWDARGSAAEFTDSIELGMEIVAATATLAIPPARLVKLVTRYLESLGVERLRETASPSADRFADFCAAQLRDNGPGAMEEGMCDNEDERRMQ